MLSAGVTTSLTSAVSILQHAYRTANRYTKLISKGCRLLLTNCASSWISYASSSSRSKAKQTLERESTIPKKGKNGILEDDPHRGADVSRGGGGFVHTADISTSIPSLDILHPTARFKYRAIITHSSIIYIYFI